MELSCKKAYVAIKLKLKNALPPKCLALLKLANRGKNQRRWAYVLQIKTPERKLITSRQYLHQYCIVKKLDFTQFASLEFRYRLCQYNQITPPALKTVREKEKWEKKENCKITLTYAWQITQDYKNGLSPLICCNKQLNTIEDYQHHRNLNHSTAIASI